MEVYCVSITFLLAFERSGKALKRLGVKGWSAEFRDGGKPWLLRMILLIALKYQGCGPKWLGV